MMIHRARSSAQKGLSVATQRRCQSTVASSRRRLFAAAQYDGEDEDDFTDYNDNSTIVDRPPIYVAATRQHVGKTSVSLALLSGLQRRFQRVGFMKPVGQESLTCTEENEEVLVDKDVALVKQHFGLESLRYKDMSPVLIPPGYTRDYLDGKIDDSCQEDAVQQAYSNISKLSDVVLCEGTGHVAVGSIVNASNARVASWIGAKMVLVANGGLGRAFDELELNRVLCRDNGVDIAGVVINKVLPEKYEQTKQYVSMALEQHWGPEVPLLGCIPDRPFLGCPALADLEKLFDSPLISGADYRMRHYRVQDLNLVATSLAVFLKHLRNRPGRTLYVCHSSRNDLLLGFLMEFQRRKQLGLDENCWEAALLVCGTEDHPLSSQVLDIVQGADAPPILVVPQTTRQATEMIHSHTPKLNYEDANRVETTVAHYEPYIDFDLLLERTTTTREGTRVGMA